MLFGGNHDAGILGGANDGFGVNGLERVHVENARLVAEVALQDAGGAHGLGDHGSTGDDAQVLRLVFVIVSQRGFEGIDEVGRILAQANHVGLAKDKGRLVVRDDGSGFSGEAEIFWTHMLEQQMSRGLARLDDIAGHDDGHVGQAHHGEEVFEGLMRGTVWSHRNARVGAGDQDVEVSVTDGDADLIQVARR